MPMNRRTLMTGTVAGAIGAVAGFTWQSPAFAAAQRLGIDYAWARPRPSAIVAAGYTFACRYLSWDTTGKNLTRAEADALLAAGVDVVSNWEYNPSEALAGYSRGVNNAREAQRQAVACGMPAGRPIYFSVDFDAQAADQPAIDAYFDGVASVIGRERTGAYGGYYVIKRLFDNGKITWGWQTYAWSGGRWDSRAQLRQVLNGIIVDGADCDRNEAWANDFGQWGAARKSIITTGDVAMVTSTSSLIALFRKGDGGVWGASQTAPGGSYGPWSKLGSAQIVSHPVSFIAPNGSIVVVGRGVDNRIWGTSQVAPGGSYSSWIQLGSGQPPFAGEPSVTLSPSGQIVVFARATDGGVWGVSQLTAGGSYGTWSRLGDGTIASTPASVLAPSNLLVVVARGTDDRIWGIGQTSPGGSYGGWGLIGSGQPRFLGDPSVTLSPSGQIVVYARSYDGELWGVSQVAAGGSYGSWSRLGSASLASSPASILAPSNLLVAVARGVDNRIRGICQTAPGGAYGSWTQIGSEQPTFIGDPSISLSPGGLIMIFSQSNDGYVWGVNQLTAGGAYGSWTRIG